MGLSGHWWTVAPTVAARLRPPRDTASELWLDERPGDPVRLRGRLRRAGSGNAAALLLHGLGGSAESPYLVPVARALGRAGWSTLRLHLRGADRRGDGLYHAGFTDDLPRVLAAPPFAEAQRIAIVGFSLGGHLALRFAAESEDPRLAGVAAVCAPVDLDLGARAIDAPRAWLYRRYVLEALKAVYTALAASRDVPTPVERVLRARTIRDWDGVVVAPWFGFASAEDYYVRMSAAPSLSAIRLPTWIVAGEDDPMVPAATLRPGLAAASASTEITWTRRGGHVGFPRDLDLGRGGERGLAGQLAAWATALG